MRRHRVYKTRLHLRIRNIPIEKWEHVLNLVSVSPWSIHNHMGTNNRLNEACHKSFASDRGQQWRDCHTNEERTEYTHTYINTDARFETSTECEYSGTPLGFQSACSKRQLIFGPGGWTIEMFLKYGTTQGMTLRSFSYPFSKSGNLVCVSLHCCTF